MKKLVITADDLGFSAGINRGIADCIDRGMISAVSISANGVAFDGAVELLKQRKYTGAGLHITLVGARPLLAGSQVKSLVDKSGNFRKNWQSFVLAYFMARISMRELEKEMEAQFRKVLDSGLTLTHANSHQHLHLLPAVLDITNRMCAKFGVSFIRCPHSSLGAHWLSAPAGKAAAQLILNVLCSFARSRIISCGLNMESNSSGVLYSGRLDKDKFEIFTRSLKDGLNELICHPALPVGEYPFLPQSWDYACAREYEAIASGSLKEYMEKENIRLAYFQA